MPPLFNKGFLSQWLAQRKAGAVQWAESLQEDEFLQRSVDDVVSEAVARATCDHLRIDTSAADGGVDEVKTRQPDFLSRAVDVIQFLVWSEFEWEGEENLFWLLPSSSSMRAIDATVGSGRLRIEYLLPPQATQNVTAEQAKGPIDQIVGSLANTVASANGDVDIFNSSLEGELRPVVEARRERALRRRDLQGQMGFPVVRRDDAPRSVPIERKVLGVERREAAPREHRTFADEWALDDADYEDVVSVITGMLRAFERSPSVTEHRHRDEEFLRDILLIALNGTYKGMATGETFVKTGKTDILVRVEDRHVFVGECKFWDGPGGAADAIDQLLGYLPWRDEKAALVFFIDRVRATEVLEKAEGAVRAHTSYKRNGAMSSDPTARRNFVLGHPSDRDREIRLAVLFAVVRP